MSESRNSPLGAACGLAGRALSGKPRRARDVIVALGLALVALLTVGCQQKMAQQPKIKPLQGDPFYRDGQSPRPLEYGAVFREPTGPFMSDGRRSAGANERAAASFAGVGGGPLTALAALTAATDPVSGYDPFFPERVTREMLHRGRERFNVFCAVCHNRTGDGRGMIVLRGFTPPPNLVTDDSRGLLYRGARVPLRDVPPGYVVNVISRGYGAMPDYASQVPPPDRWAVAAYVKALQFSQYAPLDQLDPGDRKALDELTAGNREGPP